MRLSIYSTMVRNPLTGDEDNDAAASFTVPLTFEFAVSEKIGIAAEIGFTKFFTSRDTVTNAIASAASTDVLFSGNFHWIRNERTDISSGLGFGFSPFHYESNDYKNSKFKASGGAFSLHLINARFYLTDYFAIKVGISIPGFSYKNGRITDDTGNDFDYELTLTGISLGTGLVVKF